MKTRPTARHAYLEAEVVTALAHQVRAIRMQRGWTQGELAKRLHTTQAVVSRLEDPSYGRYTLQTILELAKAFDTGLQMRFVSFVSMLQDTYKVSAKAREVISFDEDAPTVDFYRSTAISTSSTYIAIENRTIDSTLVYQRIEILRPKAQLPIEIAMS